MEKRISVWGDVQHRAEIQALGCSPATPCAPAVVVVVEREEVRRATGAKKGTIRTKSPLEPCVVCALFLRSNLSVLSRGSFGASPNPVLRYSQPPLALSANCPRSRTTWSCRRHKRGRSSPHRGKTWHQVIGTTLDQQYPTAVDNRKHIRAVRLEAFAQLTETRTVPTSWPTGRQP